jgi:hypothetical protein
MRNQLYNNIIKHNHPLTWGENVDFFSPEFESIKKDCRLRQSRLSKIWANF